jgi:hypothetical protein
LDDHFKFAVVPKFLACLVHRYEWLKGNLAPDHPLWASMLEASGKLLEYRPNVKCEIRSLSNLTGVTLEMKNAIHLHAIATNGQVRKVSCQAAPETPVLDAPKTPRERDDLALRLMTPLPTNKRVVPHLTCQQAWRAWFITTDSLPYPLRYAEGKLSVGSDVTALSRIKTCMNAISRGIAPSSILEHPEATFQCGFANLQTTLAAVDQRMLIYPYNTCGTIEKKLRAAKLCGWSGVDAAFRLGLVHTRPLVYNVASAPNVSVPAMQEATEQLVQRPKQFQCAHCGRTYVSMPSLRLHHERCNLKRDCTGESDACVVRIFTEAVAEDMQCLRCMRCYRQYCDKSSYNRHLATNAGCRKAPSFQRIAGAAVAAVAGAAAVAPVLPQIAPASIQQQRDAAVAAFAAAESAIAAAAAAESANAAGSLQSTRPTQTTQPSHVAETSPASSHPYKPAKVRCLTCSAVLYDKASFNRHHRTQHNEHTPIFSFVPLA